MLHLPSAFFFTFMSTLMVFSNKYLFNIWDFSSQIFLILIQMITNLIIIILLNQTSLLINVSIDTNFKKLFVIKEKFFKYRFLIAFFNSLHSILSLKALSGLNIPMYIMFKRCTPLVNLLLSLFLYKTMDIQNSQSKRIIAAILLMTSGVIIAGFGDLSYDPISYIYCGLSVICQAFYLSTIQKFSEITKGQSSLQTFWECSVLSIPILIVFFVITNEQVNVMNDLKNLNSYLFSFTLMLVIVSGSFLCLSQFWCTIKNNAITTSVLGVLKSIVQTLIGIFFFKSEENFSNLTYIGIFINLFFGMVYTYFKYSEFELKESKKTSFTSEDKNES